MNPQAMSSDSRTSAYAALPHVLVVDDDPTIRDLVSDYLGQHELRVSAVADGHAMQALLGLEVVDLIVLALKLKGEDGMGLARRLRFFFNDTATTEIYTLSLHDALPIYIDFQVTHDSLAVDSASGKAALQLQVDEGDRKSTRLNSSHGYISYAVFCLKKHSLEPIRHQLAHDGVVVDNQHVDTGFGGLVHL